MQFCVRNFLKLKNVFILTEGVYTTDPKLQKLQKKINKISHEEMLEMTSLGAKVMQPASIQEARLNRVEIDVRSTFSNKAGTTITKKKKYIRQKHNKRNFFLLKMMLTNIDRCER